MAGRDRHRAAQHRTVLAGVEAVSIVSDRAFPRHSHDAFGFGVMACGGHRSWSGRGPVEAAPGEIITVNPGEVHDGSPVGGALRGWRMLFLDPARMQADAGSATPVEIARPVARDKAAAALILRAFARLSARAPDLLAAEEAVCAAVAHLAHRHGARGATPRRPAPSVARALRRIDEAPEAPATLAELAALSGIGRFQLLRGFARDVGTTPHAYLIGRRVLRARDALRAGATIADAAALAGFADQSHLTRAFVSRLGVTPGRYRDAVAC